MKYKNWIKSFMDGWKNRDVEAVMKIISKDCKYYESVFEEPCKDLNEIRKLWEVVPNNQKDIEYSFEILSENDDFSLINIRVERTILPSEVRQKIDGVFQVSLDDYGLCTYFKQWTVKNSK